MLLKHFEQQTLNQTQFVVIDASRVKIFCCFLHLATQKPRTMSQQFRLKIRTAILSKAVIVLLFSIPIYACGVLCLVNVLDIIIILSCVAFISQRKKQSFFTLSHLSQMEFTTLINWTSPFQFKGFLCGIFHFIQILIEHYVSKQ